MYTSSYRVKQSSRQVSAGKRLLFSETQENEKGQQTELELWEQKVKKEALSEACKRKNCVAFGGIEAQMRRISEQVTHDAQERRKHAQGRHVDF